MPEAPKVPRSPRPRSPRPRLRKKVGRCPPLPPLPGACTWPSSFADAAPAAAAAAAGPTNAVLVRARQFFWCRRLRLPCLLSVMVKVREWMSSSLTMAGVAWQRSECGQRRTTQREVLTEDRGQGQVPQHDDYHIQDDRRGVDGKCPGAPSVVVWAMPRGSLV